MSWMIVRFNRRHLNDVYHLDKKVFEKRAFPKNFFMECYRRFPELFLVAVSTSNGKVIGDIIAAAEEHFAEILSIVVDAEYRRRGVGRALMKGILKRLKEMDVRKVYLHVDATSDAVVFHKRMGFKVDSFSPGYYGDGDAYIMVMDLSKCRL